MKQHYKISKKKLIEKYEQEKRIHSVWFLDNSEETEYKVIKHLSCGEYEVYFHKENKQYIVNNLKGAIYIDYEEVKPKSIREKLHNIQEAKKFYDKNR